MEENSTQKLLNLIRVGEHNPTKDFVSDDVAPSLPEMTKTKGLNLGVLITRQDLTLVLTLNKGFAKKKGLIKWQTILLPENLQPNSHEFSAFLGACLDNFLEGEKKISIWCSLESTSLKIKNIIIPDVPQAKIANAAFWGLKKETEFNETSEIFSFEILGDVITNGIKKKNLLVFSAPKDEIHTLEKTFNQAGYFLNGITALPFAVQNFLRTGEIQVDDPYFIIANISRENSEIYCFSQSGILLVRNLRNGSQSLIEGINEPLGMDPIDYLSSIKNPDTDEFSQIMDTSERLISKIWRTGDYCAQHYTGNTPMGRYIFYGEIDQCAPFINKASTMIPAVVGTLDPIRDPFPGSSEAELPQNSTQRSAVLTAFGIALSTNDITPNFFFTVDDQQKAKKQRKVILSTFMAGIILVVLCFFAHFQLNFIHQQDISILAQLSQKEMEFGKDIQKNIITNTIAMAEENHFTRTRYIADYIPLALIYDICRFTPKQIQLSSMVYDQKNDPKKPNRTSKILWIQGQVSDHPHSLNSTLSSYILKLLESPIFGNIKITAKQIQQINDQKILFFKASLEVL